MKLWISIAMWQRSPEYARPFVHFKEPTWFEHDERIDGGLWYSADAASPCIAWVRVLLKGIEVPTRPRELLEIEINTTGQWEWK